MPYATDLVLVVPMSTPITTALPVLPRPVAVIVHHLRARHAGGPFWPRCRYQHYGPQPRRPHPETIVDPPDPAGRNGSGRPGVGPVGGQWRSSRRIRVSWARSAVLSAPKNRSASACRAARI